MYDHKIKRFQIDGILKDDKNFERTKSNCDRLIRDMMNDSGYSRVIDLDPWFVVKFDHKEECYAFTYTVHGIYVGKRRAKNWTGISQGKPIMKA